MLSRRDFLRSGLAAVGSLAAGRPLFAGQAVHPPLGVQLYTVRRQAECDLASVLKQIRAIGYDEVEMECLFALCKRAAPDDSRCRAQGAKRTFRLPGTSGYQGLPAKLDYAMELGVSFVICPMLPENLRNTVDDFRRAADQFNQWGERARSLVMSFGFHNQNYEFRQLGNTTGFDVLADRTDSKLVCFEIDCYWITQAGVDPVAMLQKLGKRVRMLHLKDRRRGFPPSQELNKAAEHFTEVGNGTMDWKKVLSAAEQLNVEHLFVEQDESDRPPLESLRISYRNLVDLYLDRMSVIS